LPQKSLLLEQTQLLQTIPQTAVGRVMSKSPKSVAKRGSIYAAGYAAIAGAMACIIMATLALAAEPLLKLLSSALPV
jgi:hypothetical protein